MKQYLLICSLGIVILLALFINIGWKAGESVKNSYPSPENRKQSHGETVYYIDPNHGDDSNSGTKMNHAWKSFVPVNQLILAPNDRVEIIAPGAFHKSLFLIGKGTEKHPITIHFAPGRYDFYPEHAYQTKFHISNTNDTPDLLKSVAFYFWDSKNIQVKADKAEFIFRGKVMETCINQCENISIDGITFDYKRPTVSEIKVIDVQNHYADVLVHNDSKFEVIDSTLIWLGEGWQYTSSDYWQIFDPESQTVWRNYLPIQQLKFSQLDENHVRIHFNENPAFKKGLIFQTRNVLRDYAAVFMQRSKNISWKNTHVYFMHGMGFVSQFCENISFDSLQVAPRSGSGRTCAAWADILHFSGCKGLIEVKNSLLSAANDDAINIHGTHLRIVEQVSDHQLKVRFMHGQTYGFTAFVTGDELAFVNEKTLVPYAKNEVVEVRPLSEKEILLTLKDPVSSEITENDVIENITWTPDANIYNNTITHIPTRGILVTTRGKVKIENNKIIKTRMSGIAIVDDARSWFESGAVKNVRINNNLFKACGEPIINIHPENSEIDPAHSVHQNITIQNNQFVQVYRSVLSARSTENICFEKNQIHSETNRSIDDLLMFNACRDLKISGNQIIKVTKQSNLK